jgi:threonine dehydrogenase-like Zn-dependent dehydrogenase
VDLAPVVINELSLVGSRCGDMKRAIELLERGMVDPRPLIAARYPLTRADEALRHAARPGTLKVLVEGKGH